MLRTLGDFDGRFTTERGHINFPAQRGGCDVDGDLAVQIITVAFEDIVLAQTNFDEQVTGWTAVLAGFTITGAADTHAIIDTRWDLDLKGLVGFVLALSVAGAAGVCNDLAFAMAMRTCVLNTEEALAHLDLA